MASLDKLLLVGVLVMALLLITLVIGNASVSGLTVGQLVPGSDISPDQGADVLVKRGLLSFTMGILVLTIIITIVTYFVHKQVE